MDSNNFNNPGAVVAPPKPGAAKAAKAKPHAAKLPDGSGFFVVSIPTSKPAMRHPELRGRITSDAPDKAPKRAAVPKHNPNTAVSGIPKPIGLSQKQQDGNRTVLMSKPVKKGGLAERGPTAGKSTSDRTSGLEAAMHAEADRLHPRRATKISQKSKFML